MPPDEVGQVDLKKRRIPALSVSRNCASRLPGLSWLAYPSNLKGYVYTTLFERLGSAFVRPYSIGEYLRLY